MEYELALKLKQAGYKFEPLNVEEAIEACGKFFQILSHDVYNFEDKEKKWFAGKDDCGDNCPSLRSIYEPHGYGKTELEAVLNLYLAIKNK